MIAQYKQDTITLEYLDEGYRREYLTTEEVNYNVSNCSETFR